MLEGRLFKQCQFTFGQRKKDYHLLSSNVERRPPSHSSSGMWKQWGKLNSLQLTLFPESWSWWYPKQTLLPIHWLQGLTDCSETQITADWQHLYRHSNIKEGQMAEEMGLEPLQNLPTIFFFVSLGIQFLQAGQIQLQKHTGPSSCFLWMPQTQPTCLDAPN